MFIMFFLIKKILFLRRLHWGLLFLEENQLSEASIVPGIHALSLQMQYNSSHKFSLNLTIILFDRSTYLKWKSPKILFLLLTKIPLIKVLLFYYYKQQFILGS